MTTLVDVVNFNADASCLDSRVWLDTLKGGVDSPFMQWLGLYVQYERKVVIGFPGATIADIATFNPEAIRFINDHPDIFELIVRPFSHDIGLLRSRVGFLFNFDYGYRAVCHEFDRVTLFFLPPEFMLTNEQIALLKDRKIEGVFISPSRFSRHVQQRIPVRPYRVRGVLGSQLNCIPFHHAMTDGYLAALHGFDCSAWNEHCVKYAGDVVFSWRDGESSLLFPSGLARESTWLEEEKDTIHRAHIRDLDLKFSSETGGVDKAFCAYPVHSFLAWMQEFRMLGFLERLSQLENILEQLTQTQRFLWLLIINSDILSAIEKKPPQVRIRYRKADNLLENFVIQRSERGFEGEEYLVILEQLLRDGEMPGYATASTAPHMLKMRGRLTYLAKLAERVND